MDLVLVISELLLRMGDIAKIWREKCSHNNGQPNKKYRETQGEYNWSYFNNDHTTYDGSREDIRDTEPGDEGIKTKRLIHNSVVDRLYKFTRHHDM